jgi:hypothetical protein
VREHGPDHADAQAAVQTRDAADQRFGVLGVGTPDEAEELSQRRSWGKVREGALLRLGLDCLGLSVVVACDQ